MKMILYKIQNQAAIIQLNRNVTNAINLDLVTELSDIIQQIKQDPNIKSVILTSSNNKFFSIGFDIPQLYHLSRKDFKVYYQSFNRLCLDLYSLPKPTIAAITGHAIAGGCILTLCCDHRMVATGHKLMGLNEIKLGVPVPYPAQVILQQLVGFRFSQEIMEFGDFYEPNVTSKMGLVNQVAPVEEVLSTSIDKVQTIGAMPEKAFEVIKRNRIEGILKTINENLEVKEKIFIECWFSKKARVLLEEAMKKF